MTDYWSLVTTPASSASSVSLPLSPSSGQCPEQDPLFALTVQAIASSDEKDRRWLLQYTVHLCTCQEKRTAILFGMSRASAPSTSNAPETVFFLSCTPKSHLCTKQRWPQSARPPLCLPEAHGIKSGQSAEPQSASQQVGNLMRDFTR